MTLCTLAALMSSDSKAAPALLFWGAILTIALFKRN